MASTKSVVRPIWCFGRCHVPVYASSDRYVVIVAPRFTGLVCGAANATHDEATKALVVSVRNRVLLLVYLKRLSLPKICTWKKV